MRKVILLWHEDRPVGICIFSAPSASCSRRTQYFGWKQPRAIPVLHALNQHIWLLQRVVLHPSYRGAGIAAQFIRKACELCPVPFIETLSAMGQVNPVFKRAGFTRVGELKTRAKAGPKAVYYILKK